MWALVINMGRNTTGGHYLVFISIRDIMGHKLKTLANKFLSLLVIKYFFLYTHAHAHTHRRAPCLASVTD